MASSELIPPEEATYFPKLSATALTGQSVKFPACFNNRVTLVGVFHRQFGFTMLPTWVEPLEEAFGGPGEGDAAQSRRSPARAGHGHVTQAQGRTDDPPGINPYALMTARPFPGFPWGSWTSASKFELEGTLGLSRG